MSISTKGRYGLRALIYIGSKNTTGKISLKEISEIENISKRYLEQIFANLKKAGIVNSVKGTRGGYFLEKSPEKITIKEIIDAIEGEIKVCNQNENLKPTDIDYVVQTMVWDKIDLKINEVLSSTTLKMLIDEHLNKSIDMFYI